MVRWMRCGVIPTMVLTIAAGVLPANAEPRSRPEAVTVCLEHGLFLNERLLLSMDNEMIERKGKETARELFRERAMELVADPEQLREAEELGDHLFIIAEQREHKAVISREIVLQREAEQAQDEAQDITVNIDSKADTFAKPLREWKARANAPATGEVTATLVERNHSTRKLGALPVELPPKYLFSGQGEVRFTHIASGATNAVPTTLFLEALQRARRLCN